MPSHYLTSCPYEAHVVAAMQEAGAGGTIVLRGVLFDVLPCPVWGLRIRPALQPSPSGVR